MTYIKKWTPPEFNTEQQLAAQHAQKEQAHEQAHEAGYQAGFEQGMQAAQSAIEQKEAELGQLMVNLEHAFGTLGGSLELPMLRLVQRLTASLLHESQCVAPETLVTLIRETLSLFQAHTGPLTVMLNPVHHACLSAYLEKNPQVLKGIHLKVTDAIQVGGCHVETPQFFYDHSLDTQLKNKVADLLKQLANSDDYDNQAQVI